MLKVEGCAAVLIQDNFNMPLAYALLVRGKCGGLARILLVDGTAHPTCLGGGKIPKA